MKPPPPERDALAEEVQARVLAILQRRGPDGGPVFATREVEDFLVSVLLELLGLYEFEPTPQLRAMLERFCQRAGIAAGAPGGAAMAAARAYFVAHPLRPGLVAAIDGVGREVAGRGDLDRRDLARAFLGGAPLRVPGAKGSGAKGSGPKGKDEGDAAGTSLLALLAGRAKV